jgi:hypothetical protein
LSRRRDAQHRGVDRGDRQRDAEDAADHGHGAYTRGKRREIVVTGGREGKPDPLKFGIRGSGLELRT